MYFKFSEDDIFRQTVITYPKYNWGYTTDINDQIFKYFLNNPLVTGTAAQIREDSWNKTEINVDRVSNQIIFPFMDKTSGQLYFSNIDSGTVNQAAFGSRFTGTYQDYQLIFKDFITSTDNIIYKSLKNIWNSQKKLSPEFDFDNFSMSCSVHLLPKQYVHSSLRKGSVIAGIVTQGGTNTGTNVRLAQDIYSDGILRVIYDSIPLDHPSSTVGMKVGYVLYDYGAIFFKSATIYDYNNLDNIVSLHGFANAPLWTSGSGGEENNNSNWKFFGDYWFCQEEENRQYCFLKYEGINKLQHLTMMCHAPTGKLNNSINPTFLEFSQSIYNTQSSQFSYNENPNLVIKNIVSSSHNIEEDFEKETYISEVYIFDENKELLGIGKLANPIKKKEVNGYTVKLSLMI
jgi:hypothetical protein